MQTLFQDLRYGARMIRKNPGFASVVIVTLALGIGANTAIFSVVNALLLKSLPFREPERVVMIWHKGTAASGGDRTPLSAADLLDVRAQTNTFADVAAFQPDSFTLTGVDAPEWIPGVSVTANFFSVLGVSPALGRTFLPGEDKPDAMRVVVLSDAYWRSRFGADPQVVGRTIHLNGNVFSIIGVMPPGLNFPWREVSLWAARQIAPPTRRGPYFFTGIARLRPGVTLPQAEADARRMQSSFDKQKFNFNLLPVNDFVIGEVRPALLALLIAASLVLLIAAVNVANLTLVRTSARSREISIRAALGAGRVRILRQILTESLLLALLGGALGMLGAIWGVGFLVQLAPEDIPRLEQISVDGRVLCWTMLISLLAGIACGLGPAWRSAGLPLNAMLKDGGRGMTENVGWRRWRNSLVIAELALAVLLLIGAGLLLKSLWRLQQVDLGGNAERVLTTYVELPQQRYAQPQQLLYFYNQVLEKARALPGVHSVALSNSLPPDLTEYSDVFAIEGRPLEPKQIPPMAQMVHVSPEYFSALGIGLCWGRVFTYADHENSQPVALVSETTAQRFFPNEDPVGKRLNLNLQGALRWIQIVGVVKDVKYNGLADETQPAIYQPLQQAQSSGLSLILKTELADPTNLTPALREMLKAIDKDLPLLTQFSLERRLVAATAQPRFRSMLIALFAALALLLACIGVYGVISYSVTQRCHEFGIRLALGAQTHHVLRLVLGQGLLLTLAGVGCGVLASLALTRWMQNLLFNVTPTDPLTFAAITLLLTVVALLACWIPARRATRVDPMITLRCD